MNIQMIAILSGLGQVMINSSFCYSFSTFTYYTASAYHQTQTTLQWLLEDQKQLTINGVPFVFLQAVEQCYFQFIKFLKDEKNFIFSSRLNCYNNSDVIFTSIKGYISVHCAMPMYFSSQVCYRRIFDGSRDLLSMTALESIGQFINCMEMCHFPVVLAFYNTNSGYGISPYLKDILCLSKLFEILLYLAFLVFFNYKLGFPQRNIISR